MSTQEIKTEFHALIERMDADLLEQLYEVARDYEATQHRDILDDLTPAQRVELEQSIHDFEQGRFLPDADIRAKVAERLRQWHTK